MSKKQKKGPVPEIEEHYDRMVGGKVKVDTWTAEQCRTEATAYFDLARREMGFGSTEMASLHLKLATTAALMALDSGREVTIGVKPLDPISVADALRKYGPETWAGSEETNGPGYERRGTEFFTRAEETPLHVGGSDNQVFTDGTVEGVMKDPSTITMEVEPGKLTITGGKFQPVTGSRPVEPEPLPRDAREGTIEPVPSHKFDQRLADLHTTTDAMGWATRFRQAFNQMPNSAIFPPLDLGWLVGWFANAIETGRSSGYAAGLAQGRQEEKLLWTQRDVPS